MSWEMRENGNRYYTRSHREQGRIRREYVGGGTLGELAARLDEIDRELRLQESESIRHTKRNAERLDEALGEFEQLADNIGRGLLIVAGCHQHNRSEWRKRNEQG